jgi:hypothetical protein
MCVQERDESRQCDGDIAGLRRFANIERREEVSCPSPRMNAFVAYRSTLMCATTSRCRRVRPRRTARCLIPHASSHVIRNTLPVPVTEHSRNSSMANRSNIAVNCEPGSAQGTRIRLTP